MPGLDLEQSVLDEQLALTPQAGGSRCPGPPRAADEVVGVEIPHDVAICADDLPLLGPPDEAAGGVVEVLTVLHRQ